MIETEERLLESLTSLLLWHSDAGIVSLSENEAVNQIEKLAQLRAQQATSLSSAYENKKTIVSKPIPALKPHASSSSLSKQDKKESRMPPHYNSPSRGYQDQLLSQSAQAATAFAKKCSSLTEIKEKIDEQALLSLQKTAIHTFIGEGDINADIMIMSDAPSAEDDRVGHILSGKTGELFDKMLSSIDLSRANIFILPTVFWRPPGDRKTTATEVATCLPIVEKIIEFVKPKIIICLGTLAGQVFTGKNASLNKIRGQFYTYENITEATTSLKINTRPLYHPQDLMVTPMLKADAWQDLLAIKHEIKKKEG